MIDVRWYCNQHTGEDYAIGYDVDGYSCGSIRQVPGGYWRVTVRGQPRNDYGCPRVAETALREALKAAKEDEKP